MADAQLVVEREESGAGGRYVVKLSSDAEAEMTYRKGGDDTIIVDHTLVPRQFRGRGIAELLVNRMIADARESGTKVLPLCSYVVAQFERHPEWADLHA